MADHPNKPEFLTVLRRLQYALKQGNFPILNFKPLQIKFLEHLLKGYDVVGVLPTGFGKSMLFHILPYLIPVKTRKNIVIVVCLLNSIIEDQLRVLRDMDITADVIQLAENKQKLVAENLFSESDENIPETESEQMSDGIVEPNLLKRFSKEIVNGNTSIILAHPEVLLSSEGRKLMGSKTFQDNVVGCVIDEAHCVQLW